MLAFSFSTSKDSVRNGQSEGANLDSLRQEVSSLIKTDPSVSLSVKKFVLLLGNYKNETVIDQGQQVKT
jgi:hypothetical protein